MSQTVKTNMATLKELNKNLMMKCQQKRDLLMVAVKYHYLCTQVCNAYHGLLGWIEWKTQNAGHSSSMFIV